MDLVQTCIAIAMVYALLSVVASAMKETLEAAVQKRKQNFRDAIKELLGAAGAQAFLAHPRIQALTSTIGGADADHARDWPTYVDAKTFAAVALDIIQAHPQSQLAQAIAWTRTQAQKDLDALEATYNERMERLSGSFKRNAQAWLIAFGFVLAASVDADTVQMARQMATDTAARAALVNLAGQVDSPQAVQALCPPDPAKDAGQQPLTMLRCIEREMPQVLGWSEKKREAFVASSGWPFAFGVLVKALGYLLTALAISLGAPFWFDLIGKVANIRATAKPKPAA